MRKILLVLPLLLLLVGCVGADMNDAMNPYLGRSVNDVIARLGTPDSEGVRNGRPYYAWSNSRVVPNAPTPVVTRSTGTINGAPFTYTQTTMESTGNGTYECVLRVFYDNARIVRYFEGDGNYGGCGSYISRLND